MIEALLVEDDKNIAEMIAFNLLTRDVHTVKVYCAEEAETILGTRAFDIMILDIMLPGKSGLEFLPMMKKKWGLPVIVLSALHREEERVEAFEKGADDYMTKPFYPKELYMRIRALTGRKNIQKKSTEKPVDFLFMEAQRHLSEKEYEIFALLSENRGRIFSRTELLRKIWGYETYTDDAHIVDVTVNRMRKKLAEQGCEFQVLTCHGRGYYLPEAQNFN